MRFLFAALAVFGVYRFFRSRARQGPRALLTDMHAREGGGELAGEGRQQPGSVTYEIVEHDGGWAYKVGDVFSESFVTREQATIAAEQAAAAHRSAGSDAFIEYQDRRGRWHEEAEPGDDRPDTRVEQRPAAAD